MKKLFILLTAAAFVAAVSCNKEVVPEVVEDPTPEQEQTQTLKNPITLSFTADALTKVSLSDENAGNNKTAVWDENDQIKIIWYAGGAMGSATATASTHGGASTTFTATVEDAEYYYAVYPSTLAVSLDGEGNFSVTFAQNAACPTSFSDAAYYAAKTTKAAKDFAFHPISTIIKFQVEDTDATSVYCRLLNQGIANLRGAVPVTFDGSFNTSVGVPASGKQANVEVTVTGANTYYLPLPATGETASYPSSATQSDGFLLRIKKGSSWLPAAYWSTAITLTPGKMYSLSKSVDAKAYTAYYVSPTADGTGDGRTDAKPLTMAQLAAMVPFHDETQAASNILDGATIYLLGDNSNAYTTAIPASTGTVAHSYTIVGGSISATTTIATTESSTFNNAKATVSLENITFSGCTSDAAVKILAGKVRFNNCIFSGNNSGKAYAGAIYVPSGQYSPTIYINSCRFIDNAGTQNGRAIYINTTSTPTVKDEKKTYYFASLCINNSYFYDSTTLNTKNSNFSLICCKGKTILLNSTLVGTIGSNAWGSYALGCHKNHEDPHGCLVLNSVIKNKASVYKTSIYIKSSNYYADFKSTLGRIKYVDITDEQIAAQITTDNLYTDAEATFTGYTWNGTTPDGFTKQNKDQITAVLGSKDGSNKDVYTIASDFVTWLKSIKYNEGVDDALSVDIEGRHRNDPYWPGCYQN